MLAVADNGIGIAAEAIGQVFGMFTQVSDSVQHSDSGLGIGLALVQEIVHLHDGRVEAASPGLGHGSTFRVFLPVLRTTKARTGRAFPSVAEPPRERSKPLPEGSSTRVLVADDNLDAAWSVAKLLELMGYEIRIASSGKEAVDIGNEWKPDAMVLDIGLPDMDGREVARSVRAQPEGIKPVLVAVTGWGQVSDVRESLEAGFDAHLTKPVNFQELLGILEEQLTRRDA